jgi:hypothetical protein
MSKITAPFDSLLHKYDVDACRLTAAYLYCLTAILTVFAIAHFVASCFFQSWPSLSSRIATNAIFSCLLGRAFWTRQQWPRILALAFLLHGLPSYVAQTIEYTRGFVRNPAILPHLLNCLMQLCASALFVFLLCTKRIKQEIAAGASFEIPAHAMKRNIRLRLLIIAVSMAPIALTASGILRFLLANHSKPSLML